MLKLKQILIDQWHFVCANYYLLQTSVSCQSLCDPTYLDAQGFASSLLSGGLVFADKHHPLLADGVYNFSRKASTIICVMQTVKTRLLHNHYH